MSGETVIPFRPRADVPHRIERIRSTVPTDPLLHEVRILARGDVRLAQLVRGLVSVGLRLTFDERIGAYLIAPRPQGDAAK